MEKIIKIVSAVGLVVLMLVSFGCGGGGAGGPAEYIIPGSATDTTQTINGFSAADKLVMPAGSSLSVNNSDPADGKVSISTLSTLGGKVTVILAGLTSAQDSNSFAVGGPDPKLDIKTVFPNISQAAK